MVTGHESGLLLSLRTSMSTKTQQSKRGRGRPRGKRKPERFLKSVRVTINLTPTESANLEARAEEADCTIQMYLRNLLESDKAI